MKLTRISWALVTPFLLVALPGCKQERENHALGQPGIDHALRSFLGVRSIVGVAEVPPNKKAYVVTTLEFEDGELMRTGSLLHDEAKNVSSGTVTAQFLWGRIQDESKTTLTIGGQTLWKRNKFWNKFDGGKVSSYGSNMGQFKGYMVLGLAYSTDFRDAQQRGTGATVVRALEDRKYAGALVIKFFDSTQEAVQFVEKSRQNR